MSILSRAISPFVQALWRLVRSLFGRHHAGDLEAGTLAPVEAKIEVKQSEATKERIPTFQPDISGVPALVLSSMAVGAAFAPDTPIAVKTAHFPSAPAIPIIIVTPPATDDGAKQEHDDELGQSISKPVDAGRLPLRSMTNTPRVHGKPPRKTRSEEKENIRLHPSAPRLCHRRVEPVTSSLSATARTRKVVIVASPEWERAKVSRLKEAKEWSEAVKARRRSLPNSPAPSQSAVAKPALHRASLPARLPVSERLRLAVAGCASPTAPAVVIPPLWGEENVSFVLGDDEDEYAVGAISLPDTDHQFPSSTSLTSSTLMSSSSSGSISSIIEAYETDFTSSAWLGLRRFDGTEGSNRSGADIGTNVGQHAGYEGDEQHGSSGTEEGEDDDHWSEVVSLEDY